MISNDSYLIANRGLVLRQFGECPEVEEYEEAVSPQSVVLEVERTGVCGTDLQFVSGAFQVQELPAIFGHEIVGTIADLGDVKTDLRGTPLNIGDRVVIASSFHNNCESCQFCVLEEAPWDCVETRVSNAMCDSAPLNKFAGGFAEKLVLDGPERRHMLRVDCGPEIGVLFEPLSIAVEALSRVPTVFMKDVVVLGSGAVGVLLTALLSEAGAATITVVGAPGRPEELALQAGATRYFPFLGTSECYPSASKRTWSSDGMGAHYVFEFTGDVRAVASGLSLLRTHGTLLMGGMVGVGQQLTLDPFLSLWRSNLSISSVRGRTLDSFVRAAALLEELPKHLQKMASKPIGLQDLEALFRRTLNGGKLPDIKHVLSPSFNK